MSGEADSPGAYDEELVLTCGGLVVVFELVGGQRVRNRIAMLV